MEVSLEASVAIAADAKGNMMPWAGDPGVVIDRFDGRANLEVIPEYVAGPAEQEPREAARERRAVNYERFVSTVLIIIHIMPKPSGIGSWCRTSTWGWWRTSTWPPWS